MDILRVCINHAESVLNELYDKAGGNLENLKPETTIGLDIGWESMKNLCLGEFSVTLWDGNQGHCAENMVRLLDIELRYTENEIMSHVFTRICGFWHKEVGSNLEYSARIHLCLNKNPHMRPNFGIK